MTASKRLSAALSDICDIVISKDTIDAVVKDPAAIAALNNLDIDPGDHEFLADILDPDNSGEITIPELLDGIRRLRGEPRRSDIISVDLMIRSLQVIIGAMHSQLTEIHDHMAPFNPS